MHEKLVIPKGLLDSTSQRIAVLGGGFAGIASLVSLVEEGCFEPVCFEKTDNFGGTWCYREKATFGVASIMPSTVINHSKEIGALSNFPPRKEYNNFMKHEELYKYITEFAKSKDVLKHIRFNSEVVEVKRSDDYEETGKWVVSVRNTISGIIDSDVYDGVLVCVGHMNRPKMPSYPGQDLYKGEIMHTHTLRTVESFKDKTVVVVGMGCSGLDAAVEISNVAKHVYLSTRSGAHVMKRVGFKGYPYDYILLRPYLYRLIDIFPVDFVSWLFESLYLDAQFDHRLYTVVPDHHVLSKDPIINDHIGSKLLAGQITQKYDIERFTEDGVIFKGDHAATKAGAVIIATGYTWKFPFLEEGILNVDNDIINLYKCMFPPHLPHSTLAIIGFFLPFGPGFPAAELQCRWATQVLAGKCSLPSEKEMMVDIQDRYQINSSRYTPSEKNSIRVDYIQFCDDLASQFGAKPSLLKLFFTDFSLFLTLVFGPNVSYRYRLQGPHSWGGARDAIMTVKQRILYPMTKRDSETVNDSFLKRVFTKVAASILF
ncbi:dimethylaniline monooxygenase 2 [Caerostris darwini]|uniref:Flavin-containing monooxygenase n=1 Tax=Caerostris darwini TaxID=1538125 RepID=A0AAV4P9C8_9ARAC|nr:dimethylaniline monooxygenase 2 [Caerostris darwini]